jgi:putative ABC transport system permease protein
MRDVRDQAKVAVIGHMVYEQLFPEGGDPTNKYIEINGVYFLVIGKYKSTHDDLWANWQNSQINIPLSTVQKTFNRGRTINSIGVVGVPSISVSELKPKIMKILCSVNKIHPDDTTAIRIQDYSEMFRNMMNVVMGIYILVWIVGSFTLLAGIIGISNIMLIVVKERTKEIGIRRAIGATPRRIITQLVMETVFLTIVAGYTGFLMALVLLEAAGAALASSNNMMFKDPSIDFGVAVACITILVCAGVLAGMIPARRAVMIKPIDAIRD